ncbi:MULTISPECIES: hypothetical protein [unclassified Escherichia]|uniref:hypothetical protein n=1 Tax=unclassified Escherichia TaxID=2608889 RepID=UPI000CF7826C|nr:MULTISPECIES: hypothetical protein [unclassified Escherichia]
MSVENNASITFNLVSGLMLKLVQNKTLTKGEAQSILASAILENIQNREGVTDLDLHALRLKLAMSDFSVEKEPPQDAQA